MDRSNIDQGWIEENIPEMALQRREPVGPVFRPWRVLAPEYFRMPTHDILVELDHEYSHAGGLAEPFLKCLPIE